MLETLWYAIAGAIAQFVDGTLGMAFGITSSTALVLLGASAVAASAAVHFAEIGTTLASGLSHWREGNVDKHILLRIALPGAIGAFVGATVLTQISLDGARTYMSGLLFLLGLVLLIRFGFGIAVIKAKKKMLRGYTLAGLGAFAGFVDASGGGGWGPITTPTLLTATRTHPRLVIGTVSAAEFAVAVAASLGFLFGLSTAETEVPVTVVLGLMLGGVLMAPIAARLAGRLPHAPFGVLIGGVVIITNGRTLLGAAGTSSTINLTLLAVTIVAVIALATVAWKREFNKKIPHTPKDFSGPEVEIPE
jgi:uncharacterized membrane protein YfcA